jgi:hypothetical protein
MKNDKQTLDEYTQWSRKDKTAFCRSNIDALNSYIDDQNLSEVQISYIQNFCADLPKLALRNYERFKRFDNLILDGTLLNIYINHYIRNPSDCTGVPVQYKDYLPSFPQIIEWLNESTILKNKYVSDFASSQIRRLEWTDSFGLNVRKYSVLRKIILDANNTPAYNFVIDVVLLKGIRGCVGKQLLEEDFRECIPELSIKKNQKLFANSLIRNIVIEKANLHAINQSYNLIFEIALTLEYLGFKLKSPATIVFDKIYEYVKSEFRCVIIKSRTGLTPTKANR